jgi:hypothetical protein
VTIFRGTCPITIYYRDSPYGSWQFFGKGQFSSWYLRDYPDDLSKGIAETIEKQFEDGYNKGTIHTTGQRQYRWQAE